MRFVLGLVLLVVAFKLLKRIGKFVFYVGVLVGLWMPIEGMFNVSLIALLLSL